MSTSPTPESDHSQTPVSDRLRKFEEKWADIKESIKDPNTPPFERVLMVESVALGTAFVGLVWKEPPWFVYVILAATFIVFAILAFCGRNRFKRKSQAKPRPQSESEGVVERSSATL